MIYVYPLSPHDWDTIQVGDTVVWHHSTGVCTAIHEARLDSEIQQGRSVVIRVIDRSGGNPSQAGMACDKEGHDRLEPPCAPASTVTSDNGIYVNPDTEP